MPQDAAQDAGGGGGDVGGWFQSTASEPAANSRTSYDAPPGGGIGGPMTNGYNGYEEDYENEEPLLKELGINFDHIWMKIQVVLINRKIDEVLFFLYLSLFLSSSSPSHPISNHCLSIAFYHQNTNPGNQK
jgi:hypothetical protein